MKTNISKQNIPSNWRKLHLGDVADITNGKTNSQDAVAGGEYPLFDRSVLIKRSNKFLYDGVAIILPGEGAEFVPRYFEGKFDLHQRAYAIFPHEMEIYSPYLYQYLFANREIFAQTAVGSTVKSLRLPIIQKVLVNVPPISEQQKIAEILGAVDEDVAKTQEVIEATEKLKRGLMQQLFTRGIGHTKFKETKIGTIPDGWVIKSLSDLINVKHGFAFKGQYFTDQETENVLLTPANFKIGGGFNDGKFKYYAGDLLQDYILNSGDLLLTMTDLSKAGDTLGYPALVPESGNIKYLHNQRLGKVEIKTTEIDLNYLYWRLMGDDYRKQILSTATGTTVRHTSPSKIQEFKFALPPITEQQEIAEILSAVDEKISVNKKLKEKLTLLKKGLMQDLLSGRVRVIN